MKNMASIGNIVFYFCSKYLGEILMVLTVT